MVQTKRAKDIPKGTLVWRTGLSGVPPDSVRCTTGQYPVHQRTPTQTRHLREFPEALRYNSPDCPVYSRQCPVLQGTVPQELASFGKLQRLVHYNSPECPVCTGLSGAPKEARPPELASLGNLIEAAPL